MARRAHHSHKIDLRDAVSRRHVQEAAEHVCAHGGRASGLDGVTHADLFGGGRNDPKFRGTVRELCRRRGTVRLGPARIAKIRAPLTGKTRELAILNLEDRVLLRALNISLVERVGVTKINICRAGLDGRWSIARAALAMRINERIPVVTDIRSAFPSLRWDSVLRSRAARALTTAQIDILLAVYEYYQPDGVGVPLGIATSPFLLDLACAGLDDKLARLPFQVFRYLDDTMGLLTLSDRTDTFLHTIDSAIARFGLSTSPDKTQDGVDGPVDWLGHELQLKGRVDVSRKAAQQARETISDLAGARQWASAFELARRGERYRRTLAALEARHAS